MAFYVGARGSQVVQRAATWTLDLNVVCLPFSEQAVAFATTNLIFHIDFKELALRETLPT